MSMFNYIEKMLSLEEDSVTSFEKRNNELLIFMTLSRKPHVCPYCHQRTDAIKDYRQQKVYLGFILGTLAFAILRKRRYICSHCHHTFYEKVPFLQSYQRVSRDIQLTIINACRARQSFTAIASRFHLSVSTVIRYFDYIQYAKPRTLPAVLSLDEFKGNAWGQKYQVSLTSPVQHKVLDILPKRDTTAIIRYFLTYPRAIRDQVKWVVIDMSPLFRKVLRQVFPHATIVGDRFHIYRLVLWAMEKVRTRVQKQFPKHSPYVKRNKSLLKKKGKTLKEDELVRLREVLSLSVELRRAYALKESFYRVLEMTERKSAEDTLQDWLELVESADLSEFKGLLHSFRDWNDPIIQAIIQPYSNGFTEGVNNKIKVLKRVSFGIQDFNRFRNRILCMS